MARPTPPLESGQDVAAPRRARLVPQVTRQRGSLIGRRLGDYYLRELLGAGGMADVYRGYDLTLLRNVAVKVLAGPLTDDAEYVERFRAEARRVGALRHAHLVPVYHAGEETVDGQRLLYIVMPLLHESLDDVLEREGKLPPARAVKLVLQIANGLEAAHQHGLIHRDVKPGNILLDAEGQAFLADFGLAREVRLAGHKMTQQPWGTPEYMAPEQLQNGAIDQRADVYALGVVLYELLTGKRPFEGNSAYLVAAQTLKGPLKPPSTHESAITPALERVVLKALAREPDGRYPNMAEFALALRRASSHQPEQDTRFAAPVTMRLPELFWSSPHEEVRASRRRSLKWVLGSVAAATILVAGLGGTLSALRHPEQPTHPSSVPTVPPTHPKTPIVQVNPTSAGGFLPEPSLVPAPEATDTPSRQPSATETAGPTSTLTFAPTPLVLTPTASDPNKCAATQTITNNTGSTVGWAWQKPAVAGFHFVIDGGPSVGWPTTTTNTAPGARSTLNATADCKPQPVSYAILVKDSFGGQYTFVMTLQ
ncbi:MAG TPA: protein kinase [Ktedonobacterales bacterium]